MVLLFKRSDTQLVAVALVALTLGCVVSWIYWGYPFSRPGLPTQLVHAAKLESLTHVQCSMRSNQNFDCRGLEDSEDYRLDRIVAARQSEDDVVERRTLLPLVDAGLQPQIAPLDRSLDVSGLLASAGTYVAPEPGYRYGGWLQGYAVSVTDKQGTRAVILSLHSGEISNDHHVFYERVFLHDVNGWRLESSTHFFFDIAGIEGFEWPFLHGLFLLMTLLSWWVMRCAVRVARYIALRNDPLKRTT